MTQAPVAAMLTVVMPMFRLARGLSLSPFRREWLVKDVVAGIVLTTLLVPQGMAYAELAGRNGVPRWNRCRLDSRRGACSRPGHGRPDHPDLTMGSGRRRTQRAAMTRQRQWVRGTGPRLSTVRMAKTLWAVRTAGTARISSSSTCS
jgi:hypothetical protein